MSHPYFWTHGQLKLVSCSQTQPTTKEGSGDKPSDITYLTTEQKEMELCSLCNSIGSKVTEKAKRLRLSGDSAWGTRERMELFYVKTIQLAWRKQILQLVHLDTFKLSRINLKREIARQGCFINIVTSHN